MKRFTTFVFLAPLMVFPTGCVQYSPGAKVSIPVSVSIIPPTSTAALL